MFSTKKVLSLFLIILMLFSMSALADDLSAVVEEETISTVDESEATESKSEITDEKEEDASDESEIISDDEETEAEPEEKPALTPTPIKEEPKPKQLLNFTDHVKYMESSNGRFRPDDGLTRSEAARMFYALLIEKTVAPDVFADLEDSNCRYEANALAEAGIMQGYEGNFSPQKPITRAEFAATLHRFFPNEKVAAGTAKNFPDVDSDFWAKDSINFAAQKGWVNGYLDGDFRPDNNITRAETTVVMNKVLGRQGDEYIILNGAEICMFLDVSFDFWAFLNIMEASISHEYTHDNGETWTSWTSETTGLPQGPVLVDGELYYINEIGQPVRLQYVNGAFFGWTGKYTTFDEDLDATLKKIVLNNTNADMSLYDMRYSLYKYLRGNYSYVKRPLIAKGAVGWENDKAVAFFSTKSGNCFSWAAGYGLLLRKVGCNVDFIVGAVGSNSNPHGWVEIYDDGTTRIDDPELAMSRKNYTNAFFNFTYGTAPFSYMK